MLLAVLEVFVQQYAFMGADEVAFTEARSFYVYRIYLREFTLFFLCETDYSPVRRRSPYLPAAIVRIRICLEWHSLTWAVCHLTDGIWWVPPQQHTSRLAPHFERTFERFWDRYVIPRQFPSWVAKVISSSLVFGAKTLAIILHVCLLVAAHEFGI